MMILCAYTSIRATTYHVDGKNGNDNWNGLTRQTAFATIQKGVNEADQSGDVVLVWPGVYAGQIGFGNDVDITVKGADEPPIVEQPDGNAFAIDIGDDITLENFVISNCNIGINIIDNAHPIFRNLTIVGCGVGISILVGGVAQVENCVVWDNVYADYYYSLNPGYFLTIYSRVGYDVRTILDGLAGYWTFETFDTIGDVFFDSSGYLYGMSVAGATQIDGKVKTCLQFDGLDDYAYKDDEALFDANDVALAAWIKPEPNAFANSGRILSKWGNGNDQYELYVAAGGVLTFAISNGTTAYSITSDAGTITSDAWQMVAGQFDHQADELKLYINGLPHKTISCTATMNTAAVGRPLQIGKGYGGNCFKGCIDEAAILNRPLTDAEAAWMYRDSNAGHNYGYPWFADPGNGDYHLQSGYGRFCAVDPNNPDPNDPNCWVIDTITSPAIDWGDPNVNPARELWPNGGRINAGAYGNTPYASRTPWPLPGDTDGDGRVDLTDLQGMAEGWLTAAPAPPAGANLDGGGLVDLEDFAMLAEDWLNTLPWAE